MDVYHKVLHKLCEVTEGNNSKAVNFMDLVKKLGFHGNYPEIFKMLSGEGWITESPKADFVFITHWGVAEVKKTSSPGGAAGANAELKKDANRALAASRELSTLLEDFIKDAEPENFPPVEKKFAELQIIITRISNNTD
jgi:hypothetical protein